MSYLFRFTPKLFSVCIAAIGFCSNAWADYSLSAETVPAENSNIQGSSGQFAAVSSYTMYVPSDYYSSSPSKKYPAIMVLAGAGDTLGPSDPTLSAFTTEGFIVYNLTHSSQYQAALTDIKNTIAYIRTNNSRIDPSKIGVFGFSRGGFLSFLTSLDSTNGIRCAGGVAPPTNLSPYLNYKTYLPDFKAPGHEYTRWEEIAGIAQELFGVPLDPAVPGLSNTLYNASPINKINSGLNNQFYIVHGTGDTLVPFSSPTVPQSVPFTNLVNQRKGAQGGAWCDSYTGDHETPFPTGTGNQIANFFKQCTGHANYNGGPSAKPAGLSQCSGTAAKPLCSISATSTGVGKDGGTIYLTATCIDKSIYAGYSWLQNGTQLSSTTSSQTSYTIPANTSTSPIDRVISVTTYNDLGTSNPASIVISQPGASSSGGTIPSCTISVTPASIPYAGGTASLAANCTNTPYEYQWYWNNMPYRTTSTPSLSDTFTQNPYSYSYTGTYSVVARNNAGYSSPASFTVTHQGPATGNTPPVCTISVTPSSIPYAGGAASLAASCTNTPYEYQWYWNNMPYRTTSTPSLSDTFTQNPYSYSYTGTYSVVARNNAGYSSPASFTVTHQGPSTGNTPPVCTISVTPSSIPYAGGAASLAASCTNTPYEYQWYWNYMPYRMTSAPTLSDTFGRNPYSYSYTGTYSVVARNNAGYSSPASFTVTHQGP